MFPVAALRLIFLAAIGLLTACSSSPINRIDSDRASYESWPIEVQSAVLAGEARKGMTPEQVTMALGTPTTVESRSTKAGEDEIWIYRKGGGAGAGLLNNSNISLGGSMGGIGVSPGMGGRRQSPEEAEVVFRDGVVLRSDTDR